MWKLERNTSATVFLAIYTTCSAADTVAPDPLINTLPTLPIEIPDRPDGNPVAERLKSEIRELTQEFDTLKNSLIENRKEQGVLLKKAREFETVMNIISSGNDECISLNNIYYEFSSQKFDIGPSDKIYAAKLQENARRCFETQEDLIDLVLEQTYEIDDALDASLERTRNADFDKKQLEIIRDRVTRYQAALVEMNLTNSGGQEKRDDFILNIPTDPGKENGVDQ